MIDWLIVLVVFVVLVFIFFTVVVLLDHRRKMVQIENDKKLSVKKEKKEGTD